MISCWCPCSHPSDFIDVACVCSAGLADDSAVLLPMPVCVDVAAAGAEVLIPDAAEVDGFTLTGSGCARVIGAVTVGFFRSSSATRTSSVGVHPATEIRSTRIRLRQRCWNSLEAEGTSKT